MDEELRSQLAACHVAGFAWALGCCDRDRGEADDVLQESYLKVLDGRARWDGRSSFRTWLFAVIRLTAADHRRRAVLRRLRLLPSAQGADVASAAAGPDEAVEAVEQRARLAAALGGLARRQREVLLLVFYHELTVEEAAQVMGIGVGSARTHYARGKARLKELLEAAARPGTGDD